MKLKKLVVLANLFSIHPAHCYENIPFSLAMRINRICMKPETRDKRLQELKEILLERDYRSGMIDSAVQRARAIPRKQSLNFTSRNPSSQSLWPLMIPGCQALNQLQ